ncbi:hypothetical protein DXG03_007394 [Asterophora parasitica]|uniref:Uncharacterized protein n=1 Tax=Asterophora parasitica TaxID=117018 RepID=A0A9P7G8N3_9AGAR|nr:hypothetical protein DXG03_007394 [Asterophora parasitica]
MNLSSSYKRFLSLLILLSSGAAAVAGPVDAAVLGAKEPLRGRYIVQLKPTTTTSKATTFPAVDGITDRWSATRGFAGNFSSATVQRLLSSPDVAFVEQDGIVHIPEFTSGHSRRAPAAEHWPDSRDAAQAGAPPTAQVVLTQTDAPWGLARLSQDPKLTPPAVPGQYTYLYGAQAGAGVDVYVLDTGIFVSHTDFAGRAVWGATFGGWPNADGHGHGTHLAYASLTSPTGVGLYWVLIPPLFEGLRLPGLAMAWRSISGINWVVQAAQASGRPSVILLAIAGSASAALDNAVTSASLAGVHIVVAATDPNTSPARAQGAIIKVGATSIADAAVSGGSFGAGLTLFAPGANTVSAGIASAIATNTFSGASPAVAHVAGLSAYFLSVLGPLTTGGLGQVLVTTSVQGALTGVGATTPNRLASNNLARLGIVVL